ncbi:MAG: DUF2752 domain-containing protein [Chitinophagaceae bacterium]|nr:DUF2752 domain-containing protein [Chitinophagaceae bacterium]
MVRAASTALLFKQVTHFDCPGCGFQRSSIELLKGNVIDSFWLYPPLMPILFLFTMLMMYLVIKWQKGYVHLKYAYLFCAAVIVVNYIYKLWLL